MYVERRPMPRLLACVLSSILLAGFGAQPPAPPPARAGGPASEIHEAARKGAVERVRQLLASQPELLNFKNQYGRTPLLEAMFARQKQVVTFLIQQGADVNVPDREGATSLLAAALFGELDLFKLLLARGAPANPSGNILAFSPLHLAARGGHREIAELLLTAGAPLEAKDLEGRTPLATAASEGRSGIIELLLSKGASREAADPRGSTPLLLAALNGHLEAVKLLVSKGANLEARNSLGSTPYSVAVRDGHSAVAGVLAAAGARKPSFAQPVLEGDYLGQKRPGRTAQVFAPGVVSTEKEELNSVFTPDGREFYFAVSRGRMQWTIQVMKRIGREWSAPQPASFSGAYSDVDLFITADGRKLYYCSNRPLSGKGEPKEDFDIWVVQRVGQDWSEPRNLGAAINTDNPEFYPSLTRAGLLVFQSIRPDGRGRGDLYFARPERGAFRQSENAGGILNTEHFESDPYISPEGDFLVFSADPPGGFGQGDLHISFRTKDGSWTAPRNLGAGVNSEAHENCPMLTPDGKFLFFTRAGDIYWVEARILEELRPASRFAGRR